MQANTGEIPLGSRAARCLMRDKVVPLRADSTQVVENGLLACWCHCPVAVMGKEMVSFQGECSGKASKYPLVMVIEKHCLYRGRDPWGGQAKIYHSIVTVKSWETARVRGLIEPPRRNTSRQRAQNTHGGSSVHQWDVASSLTVTRSG